MEQLCSNAPCFSMVWESLHPKDRAVLFFTTRDLRAAVLRTARSFKVTITGKESHNTRLATQRMINTVAEAGTSTHIDVYEYEVDIPGSLLPFLTELTPSAAASVHGLSLWAHATTEELATMGSLLPQLHSLELHHCKLFYRPSELPDPSVFPTLQSLVFNQHICLPLQHTILLPSVAAYLPQLTHLQLPQDYAACVNRIFELFLDPLPAPAAPNLRNLRGGLRLNDHLLELLNLHAPNLAHLWVFDVPTSPLQQPCNLQRLSFCACRSIQQLAWLPDTIAELQNVGKLHLWVGNPSDEEVDRALSVMARIVPDDRPIQFYLDPYRAGTPGYVLPAPELEADPVRDLRRQVEVMHKVAATHGRPFEIIWLTGWQLTRPMLAPLHRLPPCEHVILDPKWQRDVPYDNLLRMLPPECSRCEFRYGLARVLSLGQLRVILASAPRDRTEDNPLTLEVRRVSEQERTQLEAAAGSRPAAEDFTQFPYVNCEFSQW